MRRIGFLLALAALVCFAPKPASAHDGKKCLDVPAGIPDAIKVPDGFCLKQHVTGSGVQIYSCINSAWALKAPEANLTDKGNFVGNHFLGPTWQWKDGSKVKATKTASSPGGTPADVPWLLLTVTKEDGEGKLDGTKLIQRINTLGGAAPAGACTATDDLLVGYKAEYLFYKVKK